MTIWAFTRLGGEWLQNITSKSSKKSWYHIRKLNEYLPLLFPRRRESTRVKEDGFLLSQE